MRQYKYKSIDKIIEEYPCEEEKPKTNKLFVLAEKCKTEGRITRNQMRLFCHWKSSRSSHHVLTNSPVLINGIFRQSLHAEDGIIKLHILTAIRGINIPTASAVLMFLDPQIYGVLDTRVWQLLYDFHEVGYNEKGVNFSLTDWERYIFILRRYARKHRKSVREVEKKLFSLHRQLFSIQR
jgi:hypothetical protein